MFVAVRKIVSHSIPTPTAVTGGRFSLEFVCVSVFSHDISKTDALITELDSRFVPFRLPILPRISSSMRPDSSKDLGYI